MADSHHIADHKITIFQQKSSEFDEIW